MVFAGNKAERDAKSPKSLKKWFDISPNLVTRSEAGKILPAFDLLKITLTPIGLFFTILFSNSFRQPRLGFIPSEGWSPGSLLLL
jgi:hypothetical protein